MKKNLFFITIAALSLSVFLSLSGCSEPARMKKYTAYAVGLGASEGGQSGTVEGIRFYESNTDELQEPEKKTITVSFLGSEYVAEYDQTGPLSLYGAHYEYITPEKDRIQVSSSGDIVEFHSRLCESYYIDAYTCSEEEGERIKARAVEVASEWVREIYGDSLASEYSPSASNIITSNTLWVRFRADPTPGPDLPYRYMPGQITFCMTIDCRLLDYYSSETIEKYKDKKVPDDFTLDTVREIVSRMATDSSTRIELRCDADDSYSKQFDVIPLMDGRLVCRTYVYVNGNTENRVEVVIPLE